MRLSIIATLVATSISFSSNTIASSHTEVINFNARGVSGSVTKNLVNNTYTYNSCQATGMRAYDPNHENNWDNGYWIRMSFYENDTQTVIDKFPIFRNYYERTGITPWKAARLCWLALQASAQYGGVNLLDLDYSNKIKNDLSSQISTAQSNLDAANEALTASRNDLQTAVQAWLDAKNALVEAKRILAAAPTLAEIQAKEADLADRLAWIAVTSIARGRLQLQAAADKVAAQLAEMRVLYNQAQNQGSISTFESNVETTLAARNNAHQDFNNAQGVVVTKSQELQALKDKIKPKAIFNETIKKAHEIF